MLRLLVVIARGAGARIPGDYEPPSERLAGALAGEDASGPVAVERGELRRLQVMALAEAVGRG